MNSFNYLKIPNIHVTYMYLDVLDALSTLDCTKVLGADEGPLNTMPHHTLYFYSSLILLKFIKAYSFLWTGKHIAIYMYYTYPQKWGQTLNQ